jgi:hypothetical protein
MFTKYSDYANCEILIDNSDSGIFAHSIRKCVSYLRSTGLAIDLVDKQRDFTHDNLI